MQSLPQNLPKECRKAEKILKSFVEPSRNGLDGVIPRHVLASAKGFAIFSIVKLGFVLSARAGSGIVIARLPDGSFSAPSAIGTAGMGFGSQAGAEVTEFLIVLNSSAAVKTFMAAGSLSIGGNLSVAVGPLGRNGEVSGSVNSKGKVAAMYSYSKTKGLFGGISVEGSVIIERQDANCIAYEDDNVSAKLLLSGSIPVPIWAAGLVEALERSTGTVRNWVQDAPDGQNARGGGDSTPVTPDGQSISASEYAFGGYSSRPKPKSKPPIYKRHTSSFSMASATDAIRKVGAGAFANASEPATRKGRSQSESNPTSTYVDEYETKEHKRAKSLGGGGLRNQMENDSDEDTPHQGGRSRRYDEDDVSPSRSHYAAESSSVQDSLFSDTFSSRARASTKGSSHGFDTHFESDFDGKVARPIGSRRQSGNISTVNSALKRMSVADTRNDHQRLVDYDEPTSSKAAAIDDDDPFGIFADPPAPTSLPPNLANGMGSPYPSHRTSSYIPPSPSLGGAGFGLNSPPSSSAAGFSYTSHTPQQPSFSQADKYNPDISSPKPIRQLSVKRGLRTPAREGAVKAVALYNYNAQQSGDLSFNKGDVINVTKKTETTDDWWTGYRENDDAEGIFPANFVELV